LCLLQLLQLQLLPQRRSAPTWQLQQLLQLLVLQQMQLQLQQRCSSLSAPTTASAA